jgi:hypothetical protein
MSKASSAAIGAAIVTVCATIALGAVYAYHLWYNSYKPVVVRVSCDADNGKFTVTPSSNLSALYPSLRIEGAFKMVHWYDDAGTKHWVDVSHCSYVKIEPLKLAPVKVQ